MTIAQRMMNSLRRTGRNVRRQKEVTVWDWIVFGMVGALCFLFFNHSDLLVTAQHSLAYLNGNIFDFYEACQEMNDIYGANYLPSTFVIFAIWNLPLKLLGFVPAFWGDWSAVFVFWNKLLPIGVYLWCGVLIYKLCREAFGIDVKKAKLAMYLFLTAPAGFFGQFLFCQYDSFTVFCILMGLRNYYSREETKKTWLKFIIWFGLAVTFKYYAVLLFLVLLFLRVKNVWKVLGSVFLVAIPGVIQVIFYFLTDRQAFMKAVFGFSALEYMDTSGIDIGFASISLLPVAVCLIAAWAYFTKVSTEHEKISYGIFYCCGMCFGLFSFMTWHPQWLLIAVPFWVLGIALNRNYEILLWLDVLFFAVFAVFVVNTFEFAVDQNLLKYGVLAPALRYSRNISRSMADLFVYKDTDMMFSIMVVLFAVFFIFNHPRFHMRDYSEKMGGISGVLNIRFTVCILGFALAAFSRLPQMLQAPELLWYQDVMEDKQEVIVNKRGTIVQYATIPGDSVTDVYVRTMYSEEKELMNGQALILEIRDGDTDKLIAASRLEKDEIAQKGKSHFKVENCSVVPGKQYKFIFRSELGYLSPVYLYFGTGEQLKAVLCNTVQKDYSDDYIEIREREYETDNYHIISEIYGHQKEEQFYGRNEQVNQPAAEITFNGYKLRGSFEGENTGNRPDGTGTFTVEGQKYSIVEITGNFSDGVPKGNIEVKYSDGTIASGKTKEGYYNGFVNFEKPDGLTQRVHFNKGVRNGRTVFYNSEKEAVSQNWYVNDQLLTELIGNAMVYEVQEYYRDPYLHMDEIVKHKGIVKEVFQDEEICTVKLEAEQGQILYGEYANGVYDRNHPVIVPTIESGDMITVYGMFEGMKEIDADEAEDGETFPFINMLYAETEGDMEDPFSFPKEPFLYEEIVSHPYRYAKNEFCAEGTVEMIRMDGESGDTYYKLVSDDQDIYYVCVPQKVYGEGDVPLRGQKMEANGILMGNYIEESIVDDNKCYRAYPLLKVEE